MIRITKDHMKAGREANDPVEDSGSIMEKWPGRFVLIRFIGWLLFWGFWGLVAVATVVIGVVMLINKILE